MYRYDPLGDSSKEEPAPEDHRLGRVVTAIASPLAIAVVKNMKAVNRVHCRKVLNAALEGERPPA